MKCMAWKEDKEKVVDVICLLKCEAKKMAAAGDADRVLDEIRVNMYFTLLFHFISFHFIFKYLYMVAPQI